MRNETAKRVRAARAYADLTQGDMASRLDMSTVTYKRIESGKREVSLPELDRVAEITGWARSLFSPEFKFEDGGGTAEGLIEVEGNLRDLAARLADLEWQTRKNVTGDADGP